MSPTAMRVITTCRELREARREAKGSVGVVMTMGALHEGHRALVRQARREHDVIITTIFVNPAQFGAHEDLSRYPRTMEADRDALKAEHVDLLFAPDVAEIYPAGFQTSLKVGSIAAAYEGAARPAHFDGVATVVLKMLNLTQPDTAYFGQKDAQQVAVIRRMVHDLNVPVEIAVIPTQRDFDGLALSSRNLFLTEAERSLAPVLYDALLASARVYDSGARAAQTIREAALSVLNTVPQFSVDYLDLVDPGTFEPITGQFEGRVLVIAAVRLGSVRLLDNLLLPMSLNSRAGLSAFLGSPSGKFRDPS